MWERQCCAHLECAKMLGNSLLCKFERVCVQKYGERQWCANLTVCVRNAGKAMLCKFGILFLFFTWLGCRMPWLIRSLPAWALRSCWWGGSGAWDRGGGCCAGGSRRGHGAAGTWKRKQHFAESSNSNSNSSSSSSSNLSLCDPHEWLDDLRVDLPVEGVEVLLQVLVAVLEHQRQFSENRKVGNWTLQRRHFFLFFFVVVKRRTCLNAARRAAWRCSGASAPWAGRSLGGRTRGRPRGGARTQTNIFFLKLKKKLGKVKQVQFLLFSANKHFFKKLKKSGKSQAGPIFFPKQTSIFF